jgi:four helix bundle protein
VRSAECGVRVRSAECEPGLGIAPVRRMGWKRFTEIRAWQLSMELEREFAAILARSPACGNRRFCDDALDAAASAPRNIAEGFGRDGDREFASFVNIARGSQLETQTNLLLAKNRRYMTEEEFQRLWAISEEMVKTTLGLLKELRRRRPEAHRRRT